MSDGGRSLTEESVEWLQTIVVAAADRGFLDPSETIPFEHKTAVDDKPSRVMESTPLSRLGKRKDGPPFELSNVIAEGGMGTVRLATQLVLDRKVAVKSLKSNLRSPEFARDLLEEAWITGRLEHPNIVPIHDIVTDASGQPMVVLKLISGQTWDEQLLELEPWHAENEKDLRPSLEVLLQVTNAISFAHSKGIVHLDLKPANVMIGQFGAVYVVDWGLAVSIDPQAALGLPRAVDRVGVLSGTPAYMAPEMLGEDTTPPNERTDIYLLGALLYHVLTGSPPHRGEKMLAVLEHVRHGAIVVPDSVPKELADVCRRALARDPGDRHMSVDELASDIRRFLDHMGSNQLAAVAGGSLAALRESLAGDTDRPQIYHHFGECRFGFRAALEAWTENEGARDGLNSALNLVIEHELGRGDDGAAHALLAEHPNPPARLLARADGVAKERAARESRLEELEADLDPLNGRRMRLSLALFAGVLWSAVPFALQELAANVSLSSFNTIALFVTVAWFLVFVVAGVVGGMAFSATRYNQVAFWAMVLSNAANVVWFVIAGQLGIPPTLSLITMMLLWAAGAGIFTVAYDSRAAPAVVGWVAAAIAASFMPNQTYLLMALANLGASLTAVWAWRLDLLSASQDV